MRQNDRSDGPPMGSRSRSGARPRSGQDARAGAGAQFGRSAVVAAAIAGALLSAAAFTLFAPEPFAIDRDELAARTAASTATPAEDRRELDSALAEERERRRALEAQLAAVRAELSARDALAEAAESASDRRTSDRPTSDPAGENSRAGRSRDAPTPVPVPGDKPWFDSGALAAAGLSEPEIDRLKDRWEEFEMERIRLENERVRAGGHPAGMRGRYELERALREEIGDEDYDKLLFASGQSNRVMVQEVLEASPGYRAGLRKGDTVLSYDGVRIFRPRDLREATARGAEDTLVWVEVLDTDGRERDIRIGGGPIGMKIGSGIVTPPQY